MFYHSHLSVGCNSQLALGQDRQSKQGSTTSWASWAELRKGGYWEWWASSGPLQPSSWLDRLSLSFLRNHTKVCISHFYIIVIKHWRGTIQRRTEFWLILSENFRSTMAGKAQWMVARACGWHDIVWRETAILSWLSCVESFRLD